MDKSSEGRARTGQGWRTDRYSQERDNQRQTENDIAGRGSQRWSEYKTNRQGQSELSGTCSDERNGQNSVVSFRNKGKSTGSVYVI